MSGIGLRQILHQPHHVIADIAEDACRHGRRIVRQRDAAFRKQRPQALERRIEIDGLERAVGIEQGATVDRGLAALDLPDDVGLACR